ncbi:BRO family protein [Pectobacterium odoriferum]|uniref:BRO-N domain-containing protein n=1 Tax=Pectobacterium odoriferum TaxID=78398 RepID=UPI0032EFC9F1
MKSIAKSELAFHGVKFNPVDHAGQIWLTSTELSRSLDYSNIRAVTGIYNRHADEFTSSMTLVLKLNTKGFGGGNSQRDVRVFSLRGAHLVAMLSNTPIAKEFRKWVLDILDTQIEVQAKKSRQSTATQLIPLRQTAERLITTGIGKIYPDIWKLVHERFDVEHIHQLQPAQIKEAVAYLDGLEGEFIGKEKRAVAKHIAYPMEWFDPYKWIIGAKSLTRPWNYPVGLLVPNGDYPNPIARLLTDLEQAGYEVDAARFQLLALQHHLEVTVSKLDRINQITH